jgi:hypothetical protein
MFSVVRLEALCHNSLRKTVIQLTPRQRRLLMRLAAGDLLWEVPGEKYFTQYNERTGRQIHVHPPVLEPLESAHLVRRHRQPETDHKLDFWEITEQGRAVLSGSLLPRKEIVQSVSSPSWFPLGPE